MDQNEHYEETEDLELEKTNVAKKTILHNQLATVKISLLYSIKGLDIATKKKIAEHLKKRKIVHVKK